MRGSIIGLRSVLTVPYRKIMRSAQPLKVAQSIIILHLVSMMHLKTSLVAIRIKCRKDETMDRQILTIVAITIIQTSNQQVVLVVSRLFSTGSYTWCFTGSPTIL